MDQTKINIDYCGIQNLLRILEQHGFSKAELKKISARIAAQMGATLFSETKNRRHSQPAPMYIFPHFEGKTLAGIFLPLGSY